MTEETLPPGTPIDLSNCDREPIHIPGQIQSHGFLLVLHRQSHVVVQASDNTHSFVAVHAASLLGKTIHDVLGPAAALALSPLKSPDYPDRIPSLVYSGKIGSATAFDVVAHCDGDITIVEAEPADSAIEAPDLYAFTSKALARLQTVASLGDYCEALAAVVREASHYDRVMIYRFGADWSGEVVAESMTKDKGLAPFLGLHYPASDIPAQARALFHKNNVRMLPDARYRPARLIPDVNPVTLSPLDLSHAFLRGASQMYTEYLINMGVEATLTMALTDQGRLWGLIACHHYSPRRISHAHRLVCDLLARFASLQLSDRSRRDESLYRARTLEVHRRLVEALATHRSFASALVDSSGAIGTFVDCGGVSIVSEGKVVSHGNVPPDAHTLRIAHTLAARADAGSVFVTDRLLRFYESAEAISETAAGLMALPLADSAADIVMWWRPEVARTVNWAGDPHKPVTIGPLGDRLTPRKSFELWTEEVRGACLPWSPAEVDAVAALRTSLVELLARRHFELERLASELRETNNELEAFAYVASHDLKEPLRGIYNHCTFLMEDAGARLESSDVKRIGSILRLVDRTRGLIDALLEYSRLGRLNFDITEVDMNELVAECLADADTHIHEKNAVITVHRDMPKIATVAPLVRQIYSNLLSNALKYTRPGQAPQIELGFLAAGAASFPHRASGYRHAFYVRDQGIGVPVALHETAFQIFRRLHPGNSYGGGSGAGLTIVRRAAQRLGGDAWLDEREESGARVWFVVN